MNNVFARATLGFLILTAAVSLMALVALWALDVYGGGVWWASLLVVLLALASEIGVYSSTLHEPIYEWIREPKLAAERAARAEEDSRRRAERNVQQR